jgi:hypothetical protein
MGIDSSPDRFSPQASPGFDSDRPAAIIPGGASLVLSTPVVPVLTVVTPRYSDYDRFLMTNRYSR